MFKDIGLVLLEDLGAKLVARGPVVHVWKKSLHTLKAGLVVAHVLKKEGVQLVFGGLLKVHEAEGFARQ